MSILDRVLGRGTTATLERPMTPTVDVPNTLTQTPTLRGVDDERLIEIAHRIIPPTTTVTHFFICSGNRSLIEAYHGLFRVAAPAYGGSAALYRADADTLRSRQADAAGDSLPFDGQRSMGAQAEAVTDMADVLRAIGAESPGGSVFVAYVTVGPQGVAWVRETYTTVMGDAMRQGILPFRMFETGSTEAAEYLLGSFTQA
jgi:hypothetical protein